jgi:hypothetical protein
MVCRKSIQTERKAVSTESKENQRVPGGFTRHPDYDGLPEAIKAEYSPRDYAWLPEPLKRSIIDDATLPEVTEDD